MMNAIANLTPPGRTVALAALLVAASVPLTLGFACGLPLAAFATMSAMLFGPAAAVGSILAVWLVNQLVGFVCLGYPMDASAFAWGAGLGFIALLSLAAAGLVLARARGAAGVGLAFMGAFVVYEGAVFAGCLATRTDVSDFSPPSIARILLINVAALGALLAVRALALRSTPERESKAAHALRQA
jgi:hypothetical protein